RPANQHVGLRNWTGGGNLLDELLGGIDLFQLEITRSESKRRLEIVRRCAMCLLERLYRYFRLPAGNERLGEDPAQAGFFWIRSPERGQAGERVGSVAEPQIHDCQCLEGIVALDRRGGRMSEGVACPLDLAVAQRERATEHPSVVQRFTKVAL